MKEWFQIFLSSWRDWIGSFLAAIITITVTLITSLIVNHKSKKSERRKHYSRLLFVLHDLKLFIGRCETYLTFMKESKISFVKISLNDRVEYTESSQVFELSPETCLSIQKIYNTANVIRSNMDGNYLGGVAFIKHYLKDIYNNYNSVAKEIHGVSKKYDYLSFPKTVKGYSPQYIKGKIKSWKLDDGKMDGH